MLNALYNICILHQKNNNRITLDIPVIKILIQRIKEKFVDRMKRERERERKRNLT